MTSARKVEANRANARASTGPKTPAGKARSARNAHRHGLSLPVLSDPTLARDIDDFAQQIAGKDASPELRERARLVAAAEADIIRVRRARFDLIVSTYTDDEFDSPSAIKPTGPEKMAMVICSLAGEMMRLDRYERRALSRRKFAIREFDAARQP